MGQFISVISGMGNHGCERTVKDGETVLGCQRPDCVDCILREVVRRLKRNGVTELAAELIHWPAAVETIEALEQADPTTLREAHTAAKYAIVYPQGSSVVDDLVSGVRRGAF